MDSSEMWSLPLHEATITTSFIWEYEMAKLHKNAATVLYLQHTLTAEKSIPRITNIQAHQHLQRSGREVELQSSKAAREAFCEHCHGL